MTKPESDNRCSWSSIKSYRVLEATSADEAIQKLAEEKPDVVLLDIVMPGADGLAVLKQMRSIHTDCQVIMLTALNTARTAFTAKGTGAFDYVTKPFDVEELRLRVEHALEKVHLFAELERLKEEVGRKYGVDHVIGQIQTNHRRVQGRQHGGGQEKHGADYRAKAAPVRN